MAKDETDISDIVYELAMTLLQDYHLWEGLQKPVR